MNHNKSLPSIGYNRMKPNVFDRGLNRGRNSEFGEIPNIASDINKMSLTPPVERNNETFSIHNNKGQSQRMDQKTPLFSDKDDEVTTNNDQCIIIDTE